MSDETQKTVLEQIEAIKGTEEFKTLITNSNKAYFQEHEKSLASEATKNAYGAVDSVLSELLGITKNPDEKTTEALKRGVQQLKEKIDKGGQSSEELELMKQQIASLSSTINEKDAAIQDLQSKRVSDRVSTDISNSLAGKTFSSAYSDEDLSLLVSTRKKALIGNSKVIKTEDGSSKTIYYKDSEKTKPYLNTLGEPLTTSEVVDAVFGGMYKKAKKGGNADNKDIPATGTGEVLALDMTKISTRADFYKAFEKAIAAKGIASNETEKINKLKSATFKHYKISELNFTKS